MPGRSTPLRPVASPPPGNGFGPFGESAVIFGGEQTLVDRQFANGDFQYLEVGNFIDHRRRRMVVIAVGIAVTVRVLHALYSQLAFDQSLTGSSQRSGN